MDNNKDNNNSNEVIYVNVADRVQAENQSAASANTVTAKLKDTQPVKKKTVKDTTAIANVPTDEASATEIGPLKRFLERLRERAFRYAQKKNPKQEAVFPSYAGVKKVMILFESDVLERNTQIKQLVRELQADGKTVTAWGFVNKKQVTSAILRDYRVLGLQDVNVLGKPKDHELQDLRSEHFDLVISLNVNNLMPLRYLNLYANADFRVGMVSDEPYENNFMVAVPDDKRDLVYLFDQIMLYLRKINAANTYQTIQAQPAKRM